MGISHHIPSCGHVRVTLNTKPKRRGEQRALWFYVRAVRSRNGGGFFGRVITSRALSTFQTAEVPIAYPKVGPRLVGNRHVVVGVHVAEIFDQGLNVSPQAHNRWA